MSIEFVKYDAIVDELVACSFLRAYLSDDGTVSVSASGPDERFIGIVIGKVRDSEGRDV